MPPNVQSRFFQKKNLFNALPVLHFSRLNYFVRGITLVRRKYACRFKALEKSGYASGAGWTLFQSEDDSVYQMY